MNDITPMTPRALRINVPREFGRGILEDVAVWKALHQSDVRLSGGVLTAHVVSSGGQFAAIPMNLAGADATADYVNTGAWSKKAISEAKRYLKVNVAADESASNYSTVPAAGSLKLTPGAAYVHYTPNETIGGVEFPYVPATNGVPLVADFSSSILSRPVDVSQFALIYAGAQKNIGPSGIVLVIVRDDLIGKARPGTPSIWSAVTPASSIAFWQASIE